MQVPVGAPATPTVARPESTPTVGPGVLASLSLSHVGASQGEADLRIRTQPEGSLAVSHHAIRSLISIALLEMQKHLILKI